MKSIGCHSNANSNSCVGAGHEASQNLHTDDQIEFTLPCGLPCIAVTRPYGKAFGAALVLRVGTRDDPVRLHGLAHFCEHIAFRGENLGIAEKLTEDGASLAAYTAPSYTQFHLAAHSAQLSDALSLLANVVRRRPRAAEEIAEEQKIFRHELSEYEQKNRGSRNVSLDRFWRYIVGDPHWRVTIKKQIAGIRRLSPNAVEQFMTRHYAPTNARLAIVVPRPASELRRSVEEVFSTVPSLGERSESSNSIPSAVPRPTFWQFDGGYVWIKFVSLTHRSDATMRFAAALMAHQLGDGPHSALFRRLRSDRALAYAVSSDSWPDLDRTVLDCFASISRRSLFVALDIMLDEVRCLANQGIGSEQFETFRRQTIRRHELAMEYPGEYASFLAYEMLRPPGERQHDAQSYIDFVERLNLVEINRSVAELLSPANRRLFIAGAVGPLARFRVRRRLKR